ncbi:MAG: hypothetical protein JSR18_07730 [Proteobacteria bacterium]|nr:hypothetical protein [Pseudomonadota bacterium]
MNVVLQLVAIIACGTLGAVAGWAVVAGLGLAGTVAALAALPVAMVVAVGAWALGVAQFDRLRSRRSRAVSR